MADANSSSYTKTNFQNNSEILENSKLQAEIFLSQVQLIIVDVES
jgi:hypothetical protein